eukprot:1497939-Rhodomonas_salina.1
MGVKDDRAAHKEALRTLLFAPDIIKILAGFMPPDIDKWIMHPWLVPVLQLWHNILMKYESIAKNINSAFMQEYFWTTALGLRSAGASKLHIG